jgi:hypothetical protein
MNALRAPLLLTASYLASRGLLYLLGLRFAFSLDWMWLADPGDLRDRLVETLFYFHAFPPGMNALTGMLLKLGATSGVTYALFLLLGVVLVNALFHLGRAIQLSTTGAMIFALAFSLAPPSIYFEHLFHYEWPVTTLLALSAAAFHQAVLRPAYAPWFAFFALSAAIALTRSTFHLAWFLALLALGTWLTPQSARRTVLGAALIPGLLVLAVYSKNFLMFDEFAASTFGPASLTLVTVNHLPPAVRNAWIVEGKLSPYAAVSVYAPPREYSRFFPTTAHDQWPAQLTRLEHRAVGAANFNHWWLLDVHRARRKDVVNYLRERPLEYVANIARGLRDMLSPTTTWHPRDDTARSPHHQHREVLGGYERLFNGLLHKAPVSPVGLYVFLPALLLWAASAAWRLVRIADGAEPDTRARGALLVLCVFQILYVVAASTMLTFLESARYRFQVEWAIWLLAAFLCATALRGERAMLARPLTHVRFFVLAFTVRRSSSCS